MTPLEIETAARRMYNSVGNSFYSRDEIMDYIYFAQQALIDEANMLLEGIFSTTTVADQQEYDFPTNIHSIKRITYDGKKLERIDFHEDDAYTLFNSDTTDSGTPLYYFVWDRTISLRPIPDSAVTLKVYGYKSPQEVTELSTLDVPAEHHYALVDYVVRELTAKDQNWPAHDRFSNRWLTNVERVKRKIQATKRKDRFAHVKNEEALGLYTFGEL